jgi:hypothetical protein
MQNVIQRLFMDEDIQVVAATSDSGGESSIQNIHPGLVCLRVMGEESKAVNYSLHGLQKSLENAAKKQWATREWDVDLLTKLSMSS